MTTTNVTSLLYDTLQFTFRDITIGNVTFQTDQRSSGTSLEPTFNETSTSPLFSSSLRQDLTSGKRLNDDNNITSMAPISTATNNNISTTVVESTSEYISAFHTSAISTSGFFASIDDSESVQTYSTFGSNSWSSVSESETLSPELLLQVSSGYFYVAGVIIGALAVLFIVSAFGLLMCRRRLLSYHSLPSGSSSHYDYLYRPLHKAGQLNEEYDHTFVGVSIPLLQEVTIV